MRFLLADDAGSGKTIMAGLLIKELKQTCGITEAYISRLESGERSNPSRDVVLMLGLALLKGSDSLDIWDIDVLLLSAGYAPLKRRGDTATASA